MQAAVGDGGRGLGRKAGRKPAFDAQDVVAAAIAEGIDRFTMTAVAARVGVVTAAIYRLFPSRDQLMLACLDTAAASIVTPAEGTGWREALYLWADECWRVCDDYPGLSRLVYNFPPAFTRVEEVLGAYTVTLMAHGRTPRQAMFALDFLGDTVFASHLGVEAMRVVDDDGARGIDRVREMLGDASGVLQPDESWTGRSACDTKVAFIIEGLERSWPEM